MENKGTSIGNLTIDVKLGVDWQTMRTCLNLVEMYLNTYETETLVINCDEAPNWDLDIKYRELKDKE